MQVANGTRQSLSGVNGEPIPDKERGRQGQPRSEMIDDRNDGVPPGGLCGPEPSGVIAGAATGRPCCRSWTRALHRQIRSTMRAALGGHGGPDEEVAN